MFFIMNVHMNTFQKCDPPTDFDLLLDRERLQGGLDLWQRRVFRPFILDLAKVTNNNTAKQKIKTF